MTDSIKSFVAVFSREITEAAIDLLNGRCLPQQSWVRIEYERAEQFLQNVIRGLAGRPTARVLELYLRVFRAYFALKQVMWGVDEHTEDLRELILTLNLKKYDRNTMFNRIAEGRTQHSDYSAQVLLLMYDLEEASGHLQPAWRWGDKINEIRDESNDILMVHKQYLERADSVFKGGHHVSPPGIPPSNGRKPHLHDLQRGILKDTRIYNMINAVCGALTGHHDEFILRLSDHAERLFITNPLTKTHYVDIETVELHIMPLFKEIASDVINAFRKLGFDQQYDGDDILAFMEGECKLEGRYYKINVGQQDQRSIKPTFVIQNEFGKELNEQQKLIIRTIDQYFGFLTRKFKEENGDGEVNEGIDLHKLALNTAAQHVRQRFPMAASVKVQDRLLESLETRWSEYVERNRNLVYHAIDLSNVNRGRYLDDVDRFVYIPDALVEFCQELLQQTGLVSDHEYVMSVDLKWKIRGELMKLMERISDYLTQYGRMDHVNHDEYVRDRKVALMVGDVFRRIEAYYPFVDRLRVWVNGYCQRIREGARMTWKEYINERLATGKDGYFHDDANIVSELSQLHDSLGIGNVYENGNDVERGQYGGRPDPKNNRGGGGGGGGGSGGDSGPKNNRGGGGGGSGSGPKNNRGGGGGGSGSGPKNNRGGGGGGGGGSGPKNNRGGGGGGSGSGPKNNRGRSNNDDQPESEWRDNYRKGVTPSGRSSFYQSESPSSRESGLGGEEWGGIKNSRPVAGHDGHHLGDLLEGIYYDSNSPLGRFSKQQENAEPLEWTMNDEGVDKLGDFLKRARAHAAPPPPAAAPPPAATRPADARPATGYATAAQRVLQRAAKRVPQRAAEGDAKRAAEGDAKRAAEGAAKQKVSTNRKATVRSFDGTGNFKVYVKTREKPGENSSVSSTESRRGLHNSSQQSGGSRPSRSSVDSAADRPRATGERRKNSDDEFSDL